MDSRIAPVEDRLSRSAAIKARLSEASAALHEAYALAGLGQWADADRYASVAKNASEDAARLSRDAAVAKTEGA